MNHSQPHNPPVVSAADRLALAVGAAALDRHRAEVELVAALAGSPRQALALAAAAGVTADDVANLDTLAILLALRHAADGPGPVCHSAIAAAARGLLASVGAWDADDPRTFVTGSDRWCPGGLAKLLTAVPFDPATVRAAASALAAADRRQAAVLAAALNRKAVAA